MKINGNSGLSALVQAGQNQKPVTKQVDKQAGQEVSQFDQISFSSQMRLEGTDKVQQEVSTKLSNEVRTHNTTSKIAELKEQVQSGTYKMDARETASRMLLMGAVE